MADIQNGTLTITGLDAFEKKLREIETTNPGFEKRLRAAIRQVLAEVRSHLQQSAQSGLDMKSDPRHAYKAVRYAVYKRLLGGQVNILQSRRASGKRSSYEPQRKGLPVRGGNRRPRSKRTEELMSYEGKDRGFILRFLNQGTTDRTSLGGNRGSIKARNWFGPKSQAELQNAAANLQTIIDRVINDEFK